MEEDRIEELLDKLVDYRAALAKKIGARGVVFGHAGMIMKLRRDINQPGNLA